MARMLSLLGLLLMGDMVGNSVVAVSGELTAVSVPLADAVYELGKKVGTGLDRGVDWGDPKERRLIVIS